MQEPISPHSLGGLFFFPPAWRPLVAGLNAGAPLLHPRF
jgi:hypothetical protein